MTNTCEQCGTIEDIFENAILCDYCEEEDGD